MLSVVVQAGGESQRMGENKALKPFLGLPLIERVLERLAPIADELLITTNEPQAFSFLHLPLVPDARPGLGPLGGLYTGLLASRYSSVAVVACDLPFVSAPVIVASAGYMLQYAVDVVVAKTAEGYEPLHAVYRRAACIPAIEAAMDEGHRRVISWFGRVSVRELAPTELSRYDPDGLAFRNVNTPEEFAAAEARAIGR